MVIGTCLLEFHLSACHSLKEKRMFLNRLKARIAARFNVAVAEVQYQDLWQRSVVAVVSVSTSRRVLDSVFQKLVQEVESSTDGELLRYEVEYL